MDKHIETLNVMESSYAHIRKNDSEFEAIEAAKEALQEQAADENGGILVWIICWEGLIKSDSKRCLRAIQGLERRAEADQ
ncbi:MAG: hypothetical protein LKJ21_03140 [Oscillospiraceae bacterium]|nr:hypothetical protein [Oscillospiraceae bacterium]MCI1990020.1 hypothetical protein [Oscillospiraceae bacterium]MCI2034808.1 hypothetical protein [Oscillospiraceae bacterium]